jgi:hypothetical protein
VDVVLTATLFPLNGGVYSYRLDVPHEVLALGLSSSAVTVPVSATISTNINLRVVVNGVDAKLAAPASSAFVAAQVTRAATCRLDIEVPLVALDSDGDGLPDWWETKYGLDIQNGGDAARDLDGDGCSNLQEYLAGTSPVRDGRIPEIVTTSLSAYAGGTSGLRIVSRDLDTPAASLVYSVVAAPAHGTLVLRNALVAGAGSSDQILSVGSVFTQADVDAGKLVYCDPVSDVSVAETRFQVSLRDENLAHAAAQGDIAISLFHPANVPDIADITSSPAAAAPVLPVMNGLSMDEQLKIQFACLSMNLGYIVWDYSSENSAVTGRSPSSGLTKSAYTNQYVPA